MSSGETCSRVSDEVPQIPPIPRSRRQRIAATVLAIAAFLGGYVLSAGPIAGLHKVVKFKPLQKVIEVFYAPLVWVVEKRVEPFATPLRKYIGLFR